MTRLHSIVERNLTKFDLQFFDLFLILYIFISFSQFVHCLETDKKLTKHFVLGTLKSM
jgi:hypothetical protein